MCVGKSKTLIKFDVWLVLMNLENREEGGRNVFFALSLLHFYIILTFLHLFYIQLHYLLKRIDKRKKINQPHGETYADQRYISSHSLFDKRCYCYNYTFRMLFIKTYATGVNEYNQKWVILNVFYVCLMQPATYDKWKRRAHRTNVFITWIFLRLLWHLL